MDDQIDNLYGGGAYSDGAGAYDDAAGSAFGAAYGDGAGAGARRSASGNSGAQRPAAAGARRAGASSPASAGDLAGGGYASSDAGAAAGQGSGAHGAAQPSAYRPLVNAPQQKQQSQAQQQTPSHAADGARQHERRHERPRAASSSQGDPYAYRQAPDLARSEEIIRVRKKRKKHTVRKALLTTLVALLCVVGVLGGAAAWYIHTLNENMALDDEDLTALEAVLSVSDDEEDDEAFYILVLGSDAREEDEASRSDVILLTRVDPAEGTITLVSIPRDTKVELDEHGTQKINAAYAYDGAAGAVSAVSEFAGVEISHYAEIHFEELEELVDMLGGVWVDVPVSNTQTGSSNTGVEILEGEQLMDGETALAFARERYGYLAGDFQRTENQRILATAIINAVLDTSAVSLPSTISQLAACVGTDYDVADIVALAQAFQDVEDFTVYSAMTPSSTQTIDGVSYVITDYSAWSAMMQLVEEGQDPNDYENLLTYDSDDDEEDADASDSDDDDDDATASDSEDATD